MDGSSGRKTVSADVVTLESVFDRLFFTGHDNARRPLSILMLKVDAQGMDLDVVLSAGKYLDGYRGVVINRILIEVNVLGCNLWFRHSTRHRLTRVSRFIPALQHWQRVPRLYLIITS
jgi:hypothetical protein